MASETKHTKGPWEAISDAAHPANGRITSEARPHVAKVYAIGMDVDPVASANARLIAAAPDMLAALQRCEAMVSAPIKAPLIGTGSAKSSPRPLSNPSHQQGTRPMNARTENDKSVEQVDDDASAWIAETFDDCDGDWQSRFSAENMVTAYRSGFAAGLAYARKMFMEPAL